MKRPLSVNLVHKELTDSLRKPWIPSGMLVLESGGVGLVVGGGCLRSNQDMKVICEALQALNFIRRDFRFLWRCHHPQLGATAWEMVPNRGKNKAKRHEDVFPCFVLVS